MLTKSILAAAALGLASVPAYANDDTGFYTGTENRASDAFRSGHMSLDKDQGDRTSRDDTAFQGTIGIITAVSVLCLMSVLLFI